MSGAAISPIAAGARELGDRADVVGHVAHERYAAVEVAAQHRLGLRAIGRAGEMDMGIDQPRNDEAAVEVDDARLRDIGGGDRAVRYDREDAFVLDEDIDIALRGAADAVEQSRIGIERSRRRCGRAGGEQQRAELHDEPGAGGAGHRAAAAVRRWVSCNLVRSNDISSAVSSIMSSYS